MDAKIFTDTRIFIAITLVVLLILIYVDGRESFDLGEITKDTEKNIRKSVKKSGDEIRKIVNVKKAGEKTVAYIGTEEQSPLYHDVLKGGKKALDDFKGDKDVIKRLRGFLNNKKQIKKLVEYSELEGISQWYDESVIVDNGDSLLLTLVYNKQEIDKNGNKISKRTLITGDILKAQKREIKESNTYSDYYYTLNLPDQSWELRNVIGNKIKIEMTFNDGSNKRTALILDRPPPAGGNTGVFILFLLS